jgi:hypothetical protein
MLGVVAIKMANTKLEWDGKNAKFRNNREANQYLDPEYRKGWKL